VKLAIISKSKGRTKPVAYDMVWF